MSEYVKLFMRAERLLENDDPWAARELFEQALEEASDAIDEARCYDAIGECYEWEFAYEPALEARHRAYQRFLLLPEYEGRALRSLVFIGVNELELDDFDAAEATLMRALECIDETGAPAWLVTTCHRNLGFVYAAREDWEQAQVAHFCARATADSPYDRACANANLAGVDRQLGDDAGALQKLELARRDFEIAGAGGNQARCLRDMADLYLKSRQLDEALHALQQAIKLWEPFVYSTKDRAVAWLDLAFVFDELGRSDEAEQARQRSRALVTEIEEENPWMLSPPAA